MEAFEHGYVETNGINLHVVQHGPEDGEIVLLLHGFPEFWYGWHHQITYLANRGYRVWAPDQRGYNLSDKPKKTHDYEMNQLVKDVVGLIKATKQEKVYLVGHDWGGIVAWRVARAYPELLKKLVILNAPHSGALRHHIKKHPTQLLKSSYILFFQLPSIPEKLLKSANGRNAAEALQKTSNEGAFSEEDLTEYKKAWARPRAMQSMLNWYRANAKNMASSKVSKQVTVPTQIIWGENDQFLGKEMATESLKFCDNGRGILLSDATHWLHHEQPDRVSIMISDFLTD
ncbi:alpha/beta fold hydrolase [Alkalibacterium olivapovliticus]|uniref:Pimeloyl-ACP methyl ester carboxylesterase n=1 Tax=Alkalibacterium olivapovliticus TaxID=99907 RepID=A0A2T0W6E1_9LACT|nr:alpha/beta hydrolase [Alkalibacterium olivapovliticus]PRY82278.1 pimeloyl-ACP methyl ester carboxylesterase [Alkalibacterium olivapovliticus]